MKTLKFYAAVAAIVLTTASCVENSGKYQTVRAERDSLQLENQALGSNYNQTLVILNDIETGFAQISETESQMKLNLKGVEGKTTSKREQIAAQMNAIKETMAQNKAKIEELQRLSRKEGKSNGTLSRTIKRLQSELVEKTALIQSLQDELNQKNIKIDELTTNVNDLNKNIADQNSVMEQQNSTIKNQDANLNTVWYCIGSSKKLKEAKIVSTAGLFQSKKLLDKEFDQANFTQVDLRTVTTLPTDSKKVKILSAHPKNSYNLVTGGDKKITIEITNPSKFWSVTKYLVVQI